MVESKGKMWGGVEIDLHGLYGTQARAYEAAGKTKEERQKVMEELWTKLGEYWERERGGYAVMAGDFNAITKLQQTGIKEDVALRNDKLVEMEDMGRLRDVWQSMGKEEGTEAWTRKGKGRAQGGSRLDRVMVTEPFWQRWGTENTEGGAGV